MTGEQARRERARVAALIGPVCAERELECEPTGEYSYAVTLPGTHKLKTVCNLIVGEHALRVEAFVMRQPDERREELWAWLLRRNARMYGVAFAIDSVGDVYLTGRISLSAVTEDELDRLLGAVLTYADESFDVMLEIGFGSAIRREWEWRVKRGESLANLRAFAHLVESSRPDQPSGPDEFSGLDKSSGSGTSSGRGESSGLPSSRPPSVDPEG